jgi:flagellar biosynthetic protein FliQ
MTPEFVISLGGETIKMVLMLSLPLLGVGLAVGLLIAIFQATTQIQEMTLAFVPKIVIVMLALLAASPWMLKKITNFTSQLFLNIPNVIQ